MDVVRRLVLVICSAACGRLEFDRVPRDARDDAPDDAPDNTCWPAWHAGTLTVSPPQPLAQLNTMRTGDPWLSPDARSLYFARGTPGDFFVATRPNRETPFEPATSVDELNSAGDETKLSITDDGLRVLWSTDRQGSQDFDVWEATRMSTDLPFDTPSQLTLGQVNDTLAQYDPHISGDGLRLYLAPLSGPNQFIAIATRTTPTGNFSLPIDVADLGVNRESDPALSPDERVIVYGGRTSISNPTNLWYATRATSTGPFSNATRVLGINDGTIHDQDPAVSFDGCELYFMSQRSGTSALYVSVVE